MIQTHGYRLQNSKLYKNERITRVPVHYLKWMVRVDHQEAEYAAAELKRRGTVTPSLEISGHAIDRASTRCLKQWQDTSRKGEGLHAWLVRMSTEALPKVTDWEEGSAVYRGMKFCFCLDGRWPILKTICVVE